MPYCYCTICQDPVALEDLHTPGLKYHGYPDGTGHYFYLVPGQRIYGTLMEMRIAENAHRELSP